MNHSSSVSLAKSLKSMTTSSSHRPESSILPTHNEAGNPRTSSKGDSIETKVVSPPPAAIKPTPWIALLARLNHIKPILSATPRPIKTSAIRPLVLPCLIREGDKQNGTKSKNYSGCFDIDEFTVAKHEQFERRMMKDTRLMQALVNYLYITPKKPKENIALAKPEVIDSHEVDLDTEFTNSLGIYIVNVESSPADLLKEDI